MSSPPASAALPAWKRALLERKRAKLAAGVEFQRGSAAEAKRPAGPEKTEREAAAERLVVAESLGPLRENPFMRLEGERRRRRRRALPSPPRPALAPPSPSSAASEPPALAQLLELYSSVPGIRTIRADNILIIESQEAECGPAAQKEEGSGDPPAGEPPAASSPPPPGSPGARDPFRELLSRGGSAVTEIRAAEVVVYESESSRPPPSASAAASGEAEPEPGRVSRLLQKFDRRPRGNVWRGRGRAGEAPRLHPAVPNPAPEGTPALLSLTARPGSPGSHPTGGFVQKTGSNSFVVNPRGCCPGAAHSIPVLSNGPVEPRVAAAAPVPPAGRNQQAAAAPKPVPLPSSAASPTRANPRKPKLEGPAETPPLPAQQSSATSDSSATADSAQPPPLLCSNGSFEIHPASRPDLAAIPAHDLQAQALASLRLNSRNSFLFVPRRKGEASRPLGPTEVPPTLPGGVLPVAPEEQAETLVPVTYIDEDLVELDFEDFPPLKVLSPRLEGFDVLQEGDSSIGMEDLAVPMYRPHPADYATLSDKSSNTFTVVPKRKPPSALETYSRAQLPEEEEEEEEESRAKARSDVAHQDLGQLLKKRYPTVNEIEVIGGYLSLDRSCMSKSGSRRKKMKISFNETSLQTMFEYPSESSLVEAEEEEEYATEVDEKPALFIPRPNTVQNSNAVNSGLSSYTPKHSVEFSKWQEQQYEESHPSTGAFPQDAALPGNQVMLTPADKSSLSDFGSEPALYF